MDGGGVLPAPHGLMVRELLGVGQEPLNLVVEGSSMKPKQADPSRDWRRLALFFAGVGVCYVVTIAIARRGINSNAGESPELIVGAMFAPTAGAVLAVLFGPGVLCFGKPRPQWVTVAFLPVAAIFLVTLMASNVVNNVYLHRDHIAQLLLVVGPLSVIGCITAIGEEIGWRGFLWPLMRRRLRFVASAAAMSVLWCIYHIPFIALGWYGFVGGLPAFSVALVGLTLFTVVLTERSRSVWPAVVTHGSWNGLVAGGYPETVEHQDATFTGSRYLLDEFGWLAALSMLILGAGFAWWHLHLPTRDGSKNGANAYRAYLNVS